MIFYTEAYMHQSVFRSVCNLFCQYENAIAGILKKSPAFVKTSFVKKAHYLESVSIILQTIMIWFQIKSVGGRALTTGHKIMAVFWREFRALY